ncbi:hypothetical protein, partial [Streptomyces cinereoruber]|uniref:hypothetical protein n=1 Tax=Streptomyces cinereoruber TaxID=67260 RepID=UPI00363C2409
MAAAFTTVRRVGAEGEEDEEGDEYEGEDEGEDMKRLVTGSQITDGYGREGGEIRKFAGWTPPGDPDAAPDAPRGA